MLVFIHGLDGYPEELSPFSTELAAEMRPFSPTLLGHADRPFQPGGFDAIVSDLIEQIDRRRAWPAMLFGYSFGALVAMYLAHRCPERVSGVISLGGRIIRDAEAGQFSRYLFSPERISRFPPEKREALEERYGGAGLMLLKLIRTRALIEELDAKPPLDDAALRSIRAPILLMTGEEDRFAPARCVKQVATLVPRPWTVIFPGSVHPLAAVSVEAVNGAARRFMREASGADRHYSSRSTQSRLTSGATLMALRPAG